MADDALAAPKGPAPLNGISRTKLLERPTGLVEDVRAAGAPSANSPEGFSPDFRLVLPYRGVLVWHVGGEGIVSDPNQLLFVTGGEGYRVSQPLPGGLGALMVTPERSVLAELTGASERRLAGHPLFRRRSRRASPWLQSFRALLLSWATGAAETDDLRAEELVLALLRAALDADQPLDEPSRSTLRLIGRTKEYLEAELASPIRLADVGRAVGASPAYLTHAFRRVEGTSLHRYLTHLRLARALVELPETDDLTRLALEVGFSSHSHFTAAFRRAVGVTPSQFRRTARGRPRPPQR